MWLQVKGLILHSRIRTKYSSSLPNPCVALTNPTNANRFFFFAFIDIGFPLVMYSINFATVKSRKHVLSKAIILFTYSISYSHRAIAKIVNKGDGKKITVYRMLWKSLWQCEWHLSRICLHNAEIKLTNIFLVFEREMDRFKTFKKKYLPAQAVVTSIGFFF